jgi:predicted kinase
LEKEIPTLYLMVGLSCSGKSEIAQSIKHTAIVSIDEIWNKSNLGGLTDNYKAINQQVRKYYQDRIKSNLENGFSVIADANNILLENRCSLLEHIKDIPCKKIAYVTTRSLEQCQHRNMSKMYPIPQEELRFQMQDFEIPFKEEGFDEIRIYRDENYLPKNCFLRSCSLKMQEHDDLHNEYQMNLLQHCLYTTLKFINNEYPIDSKWCFAASYHDIGKCFTKIPVRIDLQSNPVGRYYNHENIGAYYFLSHIDDIQQSTGFSDDDILDILFLINYHTLPKQWKDNQPTEEDIALFGKEKCKLLQHFAESNNARYCREKYR